MSTQVPLVFFPKLAVVVRVIKGLAVGLLGVGALGWVVEQSLPCGQVVVHVTEPDVEVVVGGRAFRIKGRVYDPIVCKLRRGQHELLMKRGGRLLFRETFTVGPGQDVVLTAWDPLRTR